MKQPDLKAFIASLPGDDSDGIVVIFARRHWASYAGQFIVSFFVLLIPIVALIIVRYYFPHIFQGLLVNFLTLILSAYYLMLATFIFRSWISYYYDIYVLTTKQIVDITQEGFFERHIAQLSLLRVQDVSSSVKGMWQTIFNYGDVLIETAGEQAGRFLLKDVPNPEKFSDKVLELHTNILKRSKREKDLTEAEGVSLPPPEPSGKEGEISQDDLGKGGEVKF